MYSVKPLISNQQIAATATTYYTAPTGTNTRITQISVTNQDSVSRTFSLYLVPSGGSATAVNRVIKDKTLQPGESWVPYTAQGAVLAAGGFISAEASAAAMISLFASGIELTS